MHIQTKPDIQVLTKIHLIFYLWLNTTFLFYVKANFLLANRFFWSSNELTVMVMVGVVLIIIVMRAIFWKMPKIYDGMITKMGNKFKLLTIFRKSLS